MNHPNLEELGAYLYQELAPIQQAEVARHLAACPECRALMDSWRTVQCELPAWKPADCLPVPRAVPWAARSWRALKWTAAAAVLSLAGFGLARLTSLSSASSDLVRAEVARQVREELARQFDHRFAQWTAAQTAREQAFQAALVNALDQLEAQRLVDYTALRQDVETLALRAEDELLAAHENLQRLAALEFTGARPASADR